MRLSGGRLNSERRGFQREASGVLAEYYAIPGGLSLCECET
jgi:hypothetical protein